MKSQCTEITVSETASVACYTELNLRYGRYSAVFFIHWVISTHKVHCIHIVKFLCCKGLFGRILYNIVFVILFHKAFSHYGICIFVLEHKAFAVFFFGFLNIVKVRQSYIIIGSVLILCFVNRTSYKSNLRCRYTAFQCFSNLYNLSFAHSVKQQIRSRIQKN